MLIKTLLPENIVRKQHYLVEKLAISRLKTSKKHTNLNVQTKF